MTETSSHAIADAMLARHSGINFTADCTFEGAPARLAMTHQKVILVVADGTGREWQAAIEQSTSASSPGDDRSRRLTLGPAMVAVAFADGREAARFDRVLRVRHDMRRPFSRELSASTTPGAPNSPGLPHPADRSPRALYVKNAELALTAAGWAIAVGWLNVVLGVLTAIVLTIAVGPLGLVWGLLIALFGGAVPFCLGYLTRTVVYRYRFLDQQAA